MPLYATASGHVFCELLPTSREDCNSYIGHVNISAVILGLHSSSTIFPLLSLKDISSEVVSAIAVAQFKTLNT